MAIDTKCDGSRAEFARRMGWKSAARVQRYITDKQSSKGIGGRLAREIEEKLDLPKFSMDTPVPPSPGAGLKIVPVNNPMAEQLLALFNELSPDGQDLLLIRANRLYTEEHQDEVSTASPWGAKALMIAIPEKREK